MSSDGEATALAQKALETIGRFGMLPENSAVLAGVSGGADSMALLHFLCAQREARGLRVFAAHVNHGLRGDEADRDEALVAAFCQKAGVPLFICHANVKARATASGETLEEAGRAVRYAFFEEKAAETGALTATAHTLSDSMETFLFHFARGTGLRGLCGIPPVREGVIRPLIRCTRRETEEYCQYFGVEYVDDSTNFSRDYTRNRIRLDVIPKLYAVNPAFDRAAARLFDSLAQDEAYLESEAEARLSAARAGDGLYDADTLARGCADAVLLRCAAMAAKAFSGKAQPALHIRRIADFLRQGGGKTEIFGGAFAQVKDGRLTFARNKAPREGADFVFPLTDGIYENGLYKLVITTISTQEPKNLKIFNKQRFKNMIDCDKIRGTALIRSKKQGDTITPAGRNVTKTLKKLFGELKVPVDERPFVPVAADEAGVVWAARIGVAQRCSVSRDTRNAVLFEITRLEV